MSKVANKTKAVDTKERQEGKGMWLSCFIMSGQVFACIFLPKMNHINKIFSLLLVTLLSVAPAVAGFLTPGKVWGADPVRFAVIGDYGCGATTTDCAEADVAQLVTDWDPDFIITTGDNNYPNGAASPPGRGVPPP